MTQTAPTPAIGPPAEGYQKVITPSKGWQAINFAELYRYRELFGIFALRDIKVRYKQTILGAAWALIQPLAFTVIGTLVFGRAAGVGQDGVQPAFLFYLASQLPWMLFNTGMTQSANSLVAAQNMLKKVYFPRLITPVSAAMVSLVDAAITFGVIILVILACFILPSLDDPSIGLQVVLVPLVLVWGFATALAFGLWLSALNVEFRDVRYVIPFISQVLLFGAVVFWPASQVENDMLRTLLGLIPVNGVIEAFRWTLLDTPPQFALMGVSLLMTIVLFIGGIFYFRRTERTFADIV